jgi:hypothetical protein
MHLTYQTPNVDIAGGRSATEFDIPPEMIAAGVEFLENSTVGSFMTVHPQFVEDFIIHLMLVRLRRNSRPNSVA